MAEVARAGKQGNKGGLKKPTLPSAEPMKQKVAKLREEINRNSQRIQDIKMIVDERRQGGRGRSESQELLRQLGEIRGQITQCLNQKSALREQLEIQEKIKKTMKQQVDAVKAKMKYTSIQEVDKQIKVMLDKLNDDDRHMDPEEEERLVSRIKQLAQSKEVMNNQKDKIQQLEEASNKSLDVSKQMDDITSRMETLVQSEREIRKKVQKVRQAEEEEVADIPALNEEKQACYEVIVECRATIKQLQEEYDLEFQEFQRKMEEFQQEQERVRREQDDARRARDEARKTEQKERDIARKQRQIEIAGVPFSEEILRCDQLIVFLSKFDIPKEEKSQATNSQSKPVSLEPGMTLVKRKNDDDDDDPFGDSLRRKAPPKSKKGKKNKAVAPEPKKLNLDMDLLMAFSQVKVTVPATPEEASAILQEVQNKKTVYQNKQKKALDAISKGERYIDTDDVDDNASDNVKEKNNEQQKNAQTENAGNDDDDADVENGEQGEPERNGNHIQNEDDQTQEKDEDEQGQEAEEEDVKESQAEGDSDNDEVNQENLAPLGNTATPLETSKFVKTIKDDEDEEDNDLQSSTKDDVAQSDDKKELEVDSEE
eukprot:TRINITY_DN1056_c0_g1_i1.p1 TRINITY_DN1056_c0_g1~~TRINITY_DN1056_c0_g1_i1.p1  ORF type:complete len:668 (-),score=108.35 TRINITY_DN1056_c0_g1_i1:415-2208(-)